MASKERWYQELCLTDFEDKVSSVRYYVKMMLARTNTMFEYKNLPETIPARMLERFLQTAGVVAFTEHKGDLYCFTGGYGGEPDVYYQSTIFTVANPALNYSASLKIGKDCEVVFSDAMQLGLLPMFKRYATLLVENEISLRVSSINSRITSLISAPDDRTKLAGENYFRQIEAGKLAIMAENAFLDGVRAQPYGASGSNHITPLIELHQYLKAGWMNDIGLQANFNMKRERLSESESELNDDAICPFVDDMLRERKEGLDRVNKMFGTNITVEFASSWADNSGQPESQEVETEEAEPEQEDGVEEPARPT